MEVEIETLPVMKVTSMKHLGPSESEEACGCLSLSNAR